MNEVTGKVAGKVAVKDEILLAQKLIQAFSPSGAESPAAKVLCDAFEELGFDESYVDDAGNAVGIFKRGSGPNSSGPHIMLNGHIDTVPLGDESLWPHHPLSGEVVGDRMWGRGACDMKSALACMAYAAKDAIDKGFQGTLSVTGVVLEEVGGLGAWHLAKEQIADVIILGEPSKLKMMLGHRGRVEVHVRSKGAIAHAAKSELGKNALYPIGKLLTGLEPLELPSGGILKGSTLTPSYLESFPKSANVVPGDAHLIIDYRNIPGDDEESILERLRAIAPELDFDIPNEELSSENGKVVMSGPSSRQPFLTPGENPQVNLCRDVIKESLAAFDMRLEEDCWWFATDAPLLEEMPNSSGGKALVIGFGPGEEELAHTTNESVPLVHLPIARKVYCDLALAYSNKF